MAFFEERHRAESFGQIAHDYDRYRPRYPEPLIAEILSHPTTPASQSPRILDVGSGTGILATQLLTAGRHTFAAGCQILAVEPDTEMAGIARSKGLIVEVANFEDWDPDNRTFDIITFGQSFHWVDPALALPLIRTILKPGGMLALVWNDVVATGEVGDALASIVDAFHPRLDSSEAIQERGTHEHPVMADLRDNGFTTEERSFEETLHYSREDWLSMVFTHSAQLTMPTHQREAMFSEMSAVIPDEGLEARNRAQLILAGVDILTPCTEL